MSSSLPASHAFAGTLALVLHVFAFALVLG
ncbi:hypothetical protein EDF56_11029 [Novosphingobium sp. PhB165]|nr:hypothetical protein EDF56_11029 [Novosphingobium sp. PhB165]